MIQIMNVIIIENKLSSLMKIKTKIKRKQKQTINSYDNAIINLK